MPLAQLRLVSQWINTAQKTGDLPDDDTLTMFANELWRAATRADAHGRKMTLLREDARILADLIEPIGLTERQMQALLRAQGCPTE